MTNDNHTTTWERAKESQMSTNPELEGERQSMADPLQQELWEHA